jgi:hypothetical protein
MSEASKENTMSTTTATMPPCVTQFDLDQLERKAGKTSGAYQRLAEMRADWVAWEKERDAEEARLRSAREARQAAAAKERANAAEAERAAAADVLKAQLRDRFFAANPEASAADYQRLEQRMVDDELLRRATDGRDAEIAALRRSGHYGM